MRSLILILLLYANVARAVDADDSARRVWGLLTGTYTTAGQVAAETALNVPPSERHPQRYVVYAQIEAPQVAPLVLYREEREGDASGRVLVRQLVVLAPDPAAQGVRMWLRQILDPGHFADLHKHPELWPAVRIDPVYGDKCPFHWRAQYEKFVGTLDGGRCEIVSNTGKPMAFEAEWLLGDTMLSIFDNTYDAANALMNGRADRVPTLYRRLSP